MPTLTYFAILGLLGVVLFFNLILLLWLAIKMTVCLGRASQSRHSLLLATGQPLPEGVLAHTQIGRQ